EAESKLGLLFNGLVKVPMQFFILFVGAMVFVFYQFVAPPLFFNPNTHVSGADYERIEAGHRATFNEKRDAARALVAAMHAKDETQVRAATTRLRAAQGASTKLRSDASVLAKTQNAGPETNDT